VYAGRAEIPLFEYGFSMKGLSLTQDLVQKPRSDIFDKSGSGTILTKSDRKTGRSRPNAAPCRDNLPDKNGMTWFFSPINAPR
jgi:hypothetical protein